MEFFNWLALAAFIIWMTKGIWIAVPYLEEARKNCSEHSAIPYRPYLDLWDFIATLTVATLWPMYRKK